jgi:hypothetical protein
LSLSLILTVDPIRGINYEHIAAIRRYLVDTYVQ